MSVEHLSSCWVRCELHPRGPNLCTHYHTANALDSLTEELTLHPCTHTQSRIWKCICLVSFWFLAGCVVFGRCGVHRAKDGVLLQPVWFVLHQWTNSQDVTLSEYNSLQEPTGHKYEDTVFLSLFTQIWKVLFFLTFSVQSYTTTDDNTTT